MTWLLKISFLISFSALVLLKLEADFEAGIRNPKNVLVAGLSQRMKSSRKSQLYIQLFYQINARFVQVIKIFSLSTGIFHANVAVRVNEGLFIAIF